MSLLVGPIRNSLEISDTQLSVLHGFAFAILYAVLGIPIGKWVDQGDRPKVLALGVFCWSVFTVLCGRAKGFADLFLFRIGVGVGEATMVPVTYSLIADWFSPAKRGRALSLFGSGVYAGIGLAFVVGGLVVQALADLDKINVPIIGAIESWQMAFIIVGLPGVLLIVPTLLLFEPRRLSGVLTPNMEKLRSERPKKFLPYAARAWLPIASHYLASSFLAMALYSIIAWYPEMLRREYDLLPGETAPVIGLVVGVAGTLGVVTWGIISDYIFARQIYASRLIVIMAASGIAAFSSIGLGFASNFISANFCLGVCVFFFSAVTVLGPAGIQELYPDRLRGVGAATFQFLVTLVGLGCGPTAVAMFSDFILQDESALISSLATTTPIMCILASIIAFCGLTAYGRVVQANLGTIKILGKPF